MIFKLFKLVREEHTIGLPPRKKGQRVLLREDSPYQPGNTNPKDGSSYHCEGVVKDLMLNMFGEFRMVVRWDNGRRNDYLSSELVVIPFVSNSDWRLSLDSNNPNITFKEGKERRELMGRVKQQKQAHHGKKYISTGDTYHTVIRSRGL